MQVIMGVKKFSNYLAYFICLLSVFLVLFLWSNLRVYVENENMQAQTVRIADFHRQVLSKFDKTHLLLDLPKQLMERTANVTQAVWVNFFDTYFFSNPPPELISLEYIRLLDTSLPLTYIYSPQPVNRYVGFDYSTVPHLAKSLSSKRDTREISMIHLSNVNPQEAAAADMVLVQPHYDSKDKVAGFFVAYLSSKRLYESIFSPSLLQPYSKVEILIRNTQGLYKKVHEYQVPSSVDTNVNLFDSSTINEYHIPFANETFLIRYFYDPSLHIPASSNYMTLMLLLLGLLLVFLTLYVYKMFAASRETALYSVHQATSELRKYKLALDSVSDHVVITDPDGIILYANPIVENITGFLHKDIVGKKAGDASLWGGLMPKEFYKNLWDTLKVDKKTFSGEIKNRRKNGEIYHAYVKISPILNKHGELVYFVGIERDITDEKMQSLIKGQLDTFFGISQELLCIVTVQGYFVKLSNSFEKTLTWTMPELLNKQFFSLVHPADLFRAKDSLQKLSNGEVATNFKCRIMCKDGSYKEFHWHVVTDFNGYLYCIAHEAA